MPNSSNKLVKTAIVVPTYNEAETLPVLVEKVKSQQIEGLGFVIVDDGSPDGTGAIADSIAEKFYIVRISKGLELLIERDLELHLMLVLS